MSWATTGLRWTSSLRSGPRRYLAMGIGGAALAAAVFVSWAALTPAPALIISTFAGGGAGDGKNALLASLNAPADVVVDAAGNLYIADQYNFRVRKVDTAGVITTVSGNGVPGYGGDGGPAANAVLGGPTGLALDATGNLYVADLGSSSVRKITPSGQISTIAGTGVFGVDPDGGPATSTRLSFPANVAIAANGALYIAESGGHRIRKVDTNGIITTVAGNGNAGFGGDGGAAIAAQLAFPRGIAVDAAGNIYIADSDNNRIRKVDVSGVITTVAGTGAAKFGGDGGPAVVAQLASPRDLGFDADGNLCIADASNQRIRKIDANGIITTIAGGASATGSNGDGGPATSARLLFPTGMGFGPGGTLYIAAESDNVVRKIDGAGIITSLAGNGKGGYCCDDDPATATPLPDARGVIAGPGGDIYIAEISSNRIRKVDGAGKIHTIAGTGSSTFFGDGGPATAAGLGGPRDMALDAAGNLYVADTGSRRIRKIDANGIITTIAGNGVDGYAGDGGAATSAELSGPEGITVDRNGNVYVSDTGNRRIRKIDVSGIITTFAGSGVDGYAGDGGAATAAELSVPKGITVDRSGNVYVADSGNYTVRRIDTGGIITTLVGNGTIGFSGDGGPAKAAQLNSPNGVAVDDAGNLYIADSGNDVLRKVDTAGIISNLAGNHTSGFSGDGGAAKTALLDRPIRVALDTRGNIFFSDTLNGRIRVVSVGHSVGGTVQGLDGVGLVLSLNSGTQTLPVSVNGKFAFPTAVADRTVYDVAVQSQPRRPDQICTVTKGSGTITAADVTDIDVSCIPTNGHTVTSVATSGGTITPSGTQSIADGFTATFTVVPNPGYAVASVTGCGVSLGKGVYTTNSITADCTVVATFAPTSIPVDGICGSDNGKTLSAPPVNLCSAGTPSIVSGSGPWTWICQGSSGGNNASCSAQKSVKTASFTSLNLTPNPANVGQGVLADVGVVEAQAVAHAGSTSAIAATAPAGSVTVTGGGSSCTAALVNGEGECMLVFHNAGNFVVTATYGGDAMHVASNISHAITINAAADPALISAPVLDRWALIGLILSLCAVVSRRR